MWCNRLTAAAVAVCCVALVGCSNEGKTGTVTGKLTLDNKPAGGAAITFLGADGRVATALTDDAGGYQADGVPVGLAAVGVASLPDAEAESDAGTIQKNQGADPAARPGKPSEAKKKGPKIPDKYADPGASGLKHTVREGTTNYDILLTR